MFIYYDLDNEVFGPAFRQYHYYSTTTTTTTTAKTPVFHWTVALLYQCTVVLPRNQRRQRCVIHWFRTVIKVYCQYITLISHQINTLCWVWFTKRHRHCYHWDFTNKRRTVEGYCKEQKTLTISAHVVSNRAVNKLIIYGSGSEKQLLKRYSEMLSISGLPMRRYSRWLHQRTHRMTYCTFPLP